MTAVSLMFPEILLAVKPDVLLPSFGLLFSDGVPRFGGS